jgi:peptide/nickel transport system substrate-binding protein
VKLSIPVVLAGLMGVVVPTLMVSGCGASKSSGRAKIGRLAAYDVNPVPREQVRTGGTLRWPLPEFPAQWNANQANGAKGVVLDVIRGVLPVLMPTDEKGIPHPDPDYVLGAKVTRNLPQQVVTYTLNPKATWSNGKPITYRDFAAQASALSGRDKRFQIISSTGYDQISRIERGGDDHQVVVTFARPFADWTGLFSPLYPAWTGHDPIVFNRGWLNRIPVTAGPFTLGGIDRTGKTVTLVRNPDWWGRPAKLDSIVFRAMDSGAIPGAFANGEVDVLDIGGDASAYLRAKRVDGAVVRRAGGPDWRQFTLNAARPPLSDLRVRQALALGIDRKAIAESDLKGLNWPVQTLGNHFFVNTQEGYRDNAGGLRGYDPARAGRLLDAAGWVRSGDHRAKDGRPLVLRMIVPAGVPGSRQEAELTQAMLKEIGVGVDIRSVPTDDLFDKYVSPGNFDLVPFSWLGTPFPVSSNRSVFAQPRGDRIQQNYARIGTSKIDDSMDQAIRELDPVKARRLTNEVDRMVWQQVSVLPLYQRPQLIGTRANLANFGACGFYDLAYEDIGFASRS